MNRRGFPFAARVSHSWHTATSESSEPFRAFVRAGYSYGCRSAAWAGQQSGAWCIADDGGLER